MNSEKKKLFLEILLYLVFGILTTLVSKAVQFGILAVGENLLKIADTDSRYYWVRLAALFLQWVAGVLFAFFTNRKWVFHAETSDSRKSGIQFWSFVGSRVFTLGLETVVNLGIVWLCQTAGYKPFRVLQIEVDADVIAVLTAAVIVVICNYFISKFLVFRKSRNSK